MKSTNEFLRSGQSREVRHETLNMGQDSAGAFVSERVKGIEI